MSLTPQNGRILLVKSLVGRSTIPILRASGRGSESKSRAYNKKLQEACHNAGLMQGEKKLTIDVDVGPLRSLLAAERGLGANTAPPCPTPSLLAPVLASSPAESAVSRP